MDYGLPQKFCRKSREREFPGRRALLLDPVFAFPWVVEVVVVVEGAEH